MVRQEVDSEYVEMELTEEEEEEEVKTSPDYVHLRKRS